MYPSFPPNFNKLYIHVSIVDECVYLKLSHLFFRYKVLNFYFILYSFKVIMRISVVIQLELRII